MPNYTIYITNNINKRFNDEENKSGLINDLLSSHYGQKKQEIKVSKTTSDPVLKEQLKEAVQRKQAKECPNGHVIQENETKCLWKGCKYSK